MQDTTFGTDLLDALVDRVRIGDNLVLLAGPTAPLDLLVDRFLAQATGQVPFVIVTVARPWLGPVPQGAVVLDWSPVSTRIPSDEGASLAVDASLGDALASLIAVDERVGGGAVFVFDRLTAVQEAWGSDAALELFLTACPRLYRRRSLALWPVDVDAHTPAFLRRLAEITQVVVELADDDGRLELTVRKADGRSAGIVGRTVHAEVVDGDLRSTDPAMGSRERLGSIIRERRLATELPQAELARRVGISPSALSQIERGVRGPSGDTLMRLWEVLGVPFGPVADEDAGYRIAHRSGRDRHRLQDGLVGERIFDDVATGELWLLEFAPGASGARPPFAVKAPETATVLRGVLDLHLGGRTETLHEGDALVATDATITGWGNPSRAPTEVAWGVHSRR